MHLENILRQIQTDRANHIDGRRPQVTLTASLWHIRGRRGRPPHQARIVTPPASVDDFVTRPLHGGQP